MRRQGPGPSVHSNSDVPAGRDARAGAALALAALLWSGNFIAGRALRHDIEPALLNLLRWTLCLALLLPAVGPKAWRCRQVVRREWKLIVGLGATGIAGFHALVYVALRSTGAVDALLILALAPVAILAGSALSGATRPSRTQWSGAGLSLVGVSILLSRGEPERLLAFAPAAGEFLMLLAVLLWAAYSLLLRRRPPDLPPDVALAASIVPALLLLAIVVTTSHGTPLVLTAPVAGALAYIVVFASLVAFLLWSYGVDAIGAERAGPYLNLMPVFGALLAAVLLGETIALSQMSGAAVVFGGIGLVARRARAVC